MHGVSQVADVARGDAGHRDSSVLRQVDAEVFGQLLNLEKDNKRHLRTVHETYYK